jgi:hypothetical protein
MLQIERTKISNLNQVNGPGYSGVPFPRYICSDENQSGASYTGSACPDTESNPCNLWNCETCANECPQKKLNPEFLKEVGMLYRTCGRPFSKKKPVLRQALGLLLKSLIK